MDEQQGQWVIASVETGEVAPQTTRYGSVDEAGLALTDLVQQGRLDEGSYEVRPAPVEGETAPALTPDERIMPEQQR